MAWHFAETLDIIDFFFFLIFCRIVTDTTTTLELGFTGMKDNRGRAERTHERTERSAFRLPFRRTACFSLASPLNEGVSDVSERRRACMLLAEFRLFFPVYVGRGERGIFSYKD